MSKRRKVWTGVTTAVGVGVALCGLGAVAAMGTLFNPAPLRDEPVTCDPSAPELPRGKRLRMLVWNLQYGAGRRPHFFYDGGPDVHANPDEVRLTLEAMTDTIARLDPDIVLLTYVIDGQGNVLQETYYLLGEAGIGELSPEVGSAIFPLVIYVDPVSGTSWAPTNAAGLPHS